MLIKNPTVPPRKGTDEKPPCPSSAIPSSPASTPIPRSWVGEDYYIATSTFSGIRVQIHHSRDLANWELVTRPLTRASQPRHAWRPRQLRHRAPCSPMTGVLARLHRRQAQDGSFKDAQLHRHRARDRRPWSDPVYVNSSGRPSLFHDDDGGSGSSTAVGPPHAPAACRHCAYSIPPRASSSAPAEHFQAPI